MSSIKTMYRRTMAYTLTLFLALGVTQLSIAEETPQDQRINQSMQFVEKLLKHSSVAKRVHDSKNEPAIALINEAQSLHDQAKQALAEGEPGRATALLDEAVNLALEAGRLSYKEWSVDEKRKENYEARLRSVRALLDAEHRVAKEKGQDDKAFDAKVDELIQKSMRFASRYDYTSARQYLDDAYQMVKIKIQDLRGGDTLMRTLTFKTKVEEYHYELDRNDTYSMLIDSLTREEGQMKIDSIVDNYLKKARSLRESAQEQAANGNHEAAVKTLEQSTMNLVRALRNAGFFVPG